MPTYRFRNLIFEGGGVKSIAYIGAMQVLEQKGILSAIQRVGGTSAGAINATLFALGFNNNEQKEILHNLDFNKFMDDSLFVIRDINRLLNEFGWHKGDFFYQWIGDRIQDKLNNRNATFRDLKEQGKPNLYVYGTNLSTKFGEVFSEEHTPTMRIADAVRISMSIPLFFAAVRNVRNDVYVDGGVLGNYPIKLFDRKKYIEKANQNVMAIKTNYYDKENENLHDRHPESSPYVYNRETLGMRLDSKQEIGVFRHGNEPPRQKIDGFFDYIKALMATILDNQGHAHLHSDDWQRTVYIDTLRVGAIDFDLSDEKKEKLRESGRKGVEKYFEWFDDSNNSPINKPQK